VNVLDLKGDRELIRKLKRMEPEFYDLMRSELGHAGLMLMSRANSYVPVENGKLRSSAAVKGKAGRGYIAVAAGYTDPKAVAVHYGIHGGKFYKNLPSMGWFSTAFFGWFRPWFNNYIRSRIEWLLRQWGKG
jgi:hypothetical protein